VFFSDGDRRRYITVLGEACKTCGVRVIGNCLMTNHVHLIVVPADKTSLARAMKRSQGEHTLYINEEQGRRGHLWHGRFFSCPMDLNHTQTELGYVELNPVRAGMVKEPWVYSWSSAAAHCAIRDDRLLKLARWFQHYTGAEWQQALLSGMENRGYGDTIRRHTKSGAPLGDQDYFRRMKSPAAAE
jgi:putative transposase